MYRFTAGSRGGYCGDVGLGHQQEKLNSNNLALVGVCAGCAPRHLLAYHGHTNNFDAEWLLVAQTHTLPRNTNNGGEYFINSK